MFNELKEVKILQRNKRFEESPSKSRGVFRTQLSVSDEYF